MVERLDRRRRRRAARGAAEVAGSPSSLLSDAVSRIGTGKVITVTAVSQCRSRNSGLSRPEPADAGWLDRYRCP